MPLRPAAALATLLAASTALAQTTQPAGGGLGLVDRPQADGRLSFQAHDGWKPRVNLNADVAMVYGIGPTLAERIETWRAKGYTIHVMTGVAWGEYKDYLFGQFDGVNHRDEGQKRKDGSERSHGVDVPYMSPGEAFGRYLTVGVKNALDAGAEAIHMEEPEFWADTGWEENFKREWKAYYNEDWIPPDQSPDAQYRASKLKYYLYRRALATVFDFVKEYNKANGRDVKCYVPTHSLVNYALWCIVSPQSSLIDVGCDGYIAQVWTGTARSRVNYDGVERERTFEVAFLEYNAMQNLVRGNGRRMWYLNDPIEDNPRHGWDDYQKNWESTLVASLLQPEVHHYEIMPWPHRIFEKPYPEYERRRGEPRAPLVMMPKAYETELQTVITAMGDLKQPVEQTKWELSGTHGVGILISDTLMFQRAQPVPSDPHLGNFFGLGLPLVKHGVPAEPVQIETASLDPYKVLVLTYEGQKPPTPEFHDKLAQWVNAGGALVVIDDDKDPYHKVREWWNTSGANYETPRHHLFEKLGVDRGAAGVTKVGKGVVLYDATSPAAHSRRKGGADYVRSLTKQASEAIGHAWKESNAFALRRGPYLIAAGLSESVPGAPVPRVEGRFLPLFDPTHTIVHGMELPADKRVFAVDLDKLPPDGVGVVAAACRVRDERVTDAQVTFKADGIADTRGIVSVKLPAAPKSVRVAGEAAAVEDYDFAEGMLRVRFPNSVEGVDVVIER